MNDFTFFRDGFRPEPVWPDTKLTAVRRNLPGVSRKQVVVDEKGFYWMVKWDARDSDESAARMAHALRLPQPWVKDFSGKYDEGGFTTHTSSGGKATLHEWLDEAQSLDSLQDITDRIKVQNSQHSILSYLIGDGDRHNGNAVVWYNDVFAIDRTRSLGFAGMFSFGRFFITSEVMRLVGPDAFTKYTDRLANISTTEWLELAGSAGKQYADSLRTRKGDVRRTIAAEAATHMPRVMGETRDAWKNFIEGEGIRYR